MRRPRHKLVCKSTLTAPLSCCSPSSGGLSSVHVPSVHEQRELVCAHNSPLAESVRHLHKFTDTESEMLKMKVAQL